MLAALLLRLPVLPAQLSRLFADGSMPLLQLEVGGGGPGWVGWGGGCGRGGAGGGGGGGGWGGGPGVCRWGT